MNFSYEFTVHCRFQLQVIIVPVYCVKMASNCEHCFVYV